MSYKRLLDVEFYDTQENAWAQAMFLVHGIDDVLWTDSPEAVAKYIKEECKRLKRKEV